jgi:hypothetical protein
MAVEDLESPVETLEVLSDPDAMAAIAEDRAGTGEGDRGLGDGSDHGQEVGPRRGVRYELRLSRVARRALAETLPESVAAAV